MEFVWTYIEDMVGLEVHVIVELHFCEKIFVRKAA
jgi:hypothetical protein